MKKQPKPLVRKPSISERMEAVIEDKPDAIDWTSSRWASELKVNLASVKRAPKWLDITRTRRGNELSENELVILSVCVRLETVTSERVASETSISDTTVKARLRYFVAMGWLESHQGGNTYACYTLTDAGRKYHARIGKRKK